MQDLPPAVLLNPDHPTRNRSHQNKTKQKGWSPEEDAILAGNITDPDTINWTTLYPLLPLKTPKQVIERWTRVLDPRLKKGSWTIDEDRTLTEFVSAHGSNSWTECAKLLPGRIGKQCRERWCNFLSPDLHREPFTDEEDALLLRLHGTIGNNWQRISAHFQGRSANTIKNRWHLLARKERQCAKPKGTAKIKIPFLGRENEAPPPE
jgi:myb proto-oncogene protein